MPKKQNGTLKRIAPDVPKKAAEISAAINELAQFLDDLKDELGGSITGLPGSKPTRLTRRQVLNARILRDAAQRRLHRLSFLIWFKAEDAAALFAEAKREIAHKPPFVSEEDWLVYEVVRILAEAQQAANPKPH